MDAGALTLWSGMAEEEALSGTQRKAANRWGSITRFTSRSPPRNRNLESISLQRRVTNEPCGCQLGATFAGILLYRTADPSYLFAGDGSSLTLKPPDLGIGRFLRTVAA